MKINIFYHCIFIFYFFYFLMKHHSSAGRWSQKAIGDTEWRERILGNSSKWSWEENTWSQFKIRECKKLFHWFLLLLLVFQADGFCSFNICNIMIITLFECNYCLACSMANAFFSLLHHKHFIIGASLVFPWFLLNWTDSYGISFILKNGSLRRLHSNVNKVLLDLDFYHFSDIFFLTDS